MQSPPLGKRSVVMHWELGFVRDLTVLSPIIPTLRQRNWFAADDLIMLRSLRVADRGGTPANCQPIDLIANAPFRSTLRHLAIGSDREELLPAERLLELVESLPSLRQLELRSNIALDDARLTALEQLPLEAITLWTPGDDALLARMIAGPWPHLRALGLVTRGATGRGVPELMQPLLEGARHGGLVELSLFGCGFEDDLIAELATRPLGKRLQRLGLNWRSVTINPLGVVSDALAQVELIWPRPPGVELEADDEYQFARRLRTGMGRKREALEHAKRACSSSRNYFHWTELGYTHEGLDELPEAHAAMTRAIELDPSQWGGWAGCGDALRKLGRYVEAHDIYSRGLARDPTWRALHYGRGRTFECEGKLDEAIASFDAAALHATSETNRAWYWGRIGASLLHAGRVAEARDHIARARALDPASPRLARFDIHARLAAGLPAEAMSIANELVEQDDDSRLARAAVFQASGSIEQAKTLYQQIVDGTVCPGMIALAWLGLATLGDDPFAAFSSIVDPAVLGDAIAAQFTRATPKVHDTVDRCDDRIHCAMAAIGGAAVAGRLDEATVRHVALIDYLRGPAQMKHIDPWLEQAELMRMAGARSDAAVLAAAYRSATGGAMLDP